MRICFAVRADIVGFGDAGVRTSFNAGDATSLTALGSADAKAGPAGWAAPLAAGRVGVELTFS